MADVAKMAPDAWSATSQARSGVDADWVSSFGSSTLTSLVKKALSGNLDLKIAATRLAQARRDIELVRAAGNPTMDVTLAPQRQKQNFVGFPFGQDSSAQGPSASAEPTVVGNITETYRLSGNLQWEIDVWGRIRAGTAAAVAAAESADQEYKAARASLAASVAKTWFLQVENTQQAELALESKKLAEDTAEALESRFRTGQQGQSSLGAQLRLARSDVATAEAALQQRREAAAQAARALEILLGDYPTAQNRGSLLPVLASTPPAGLPSELLLRRPDILAAERRFAARGMSQKEARRAVFPRLILTGSLGSSTDAFSNLLKSDYGVWSLGGSVIQAVLTGGKLKAESNRRKDQEEEALLSLQKSVLSAFGEVENHLAGERFLAAREDALQRAANLATEADTEARADFRQGIGEILTVFQTQQRAVQAKSALLLVRRLRLENRVNLHLALGGDFKI
jgi:NodT family efflux transporter outer membrane factor (OMF) lipoprotein